MKKPWYTIFGVGSTNYVHYQYASRKLHRRLQQLGAREWCEGGEGDESSSSGIERAFDTWTFSRLIPALESINGFKALRGDPTSLPPAKWSVVPCEPSFSETNEEEEEEEELIHVEVTLNERVTAPSHWQDVRHITFSKVPTSSRELNYEPGSTLTILPRNSPSSVSRLLSLSFLSSYDPDASVSISPTHPSHPKSTYTTTLRKLLVQRLDFTAVPTRAFFYLLSFFTDDPVHKEKLWDFASGSEEGLEDMYDYATRPRRTILEVLEEFNSVKHLPIEWLVELIPMMRRREFSICSAAKQDGSSVEILVAIVNYKTKFLRAPRKGVCTTYLSTLPVGAKVRVGIEEGTMRLPPQETPIICVGPGTGIAPFRAFMQARTKSSENLVFFGCRDRAKDLFFEREWEDELSHARVVVASSRTQERKVYVQDKIVEHAQEVFELLEEGAWIYICGAEGQMPKSVAAAFKKVVRTEGGMEEDEAERWWSEGGRGGRVWEECW
ncbi:riboflavin synthase domain-like protein [Atractiella rhizophila]|nr:riboflavin synthase domain-like protein [Atractiella rhizophila]